MKQKNYRIVSHTLLKRIKRIFIHRNYKDELFRRLFRDKKALLELYNAINQTTYTDETLLVIYTLEDAIYMSYKNDVSFIISNVLSLYEHQSTINPNMPLRGLIYFTRQYEGYIAQKKLDIHSTQLQKIPFPQFIVFYNGSEPLENGADSQILSLSDAFEVPSNPDMEPCLQCTVTIYDINYGHNMNLMKSCQTLEGYSLLISYIKDNLRHKYPLAQAVDLAVQKCIEHDILTDFLSKHKAEVTNMILSEFNLKEHIEFEKNVIRKDLGKVIAEKEAVISEKEAIISAQKAELDRLKAKLFK